MTLEYAHERPVRYEYNAEAGLWYIRGLSREKAKELFSKAYHSDGRMTRFKHDEYYYVLTYQYNGGDYYYTLVRGYNPDY